MVARTSLVDTILILWLCVVCLLGNYEFRDITLGNCDFEFEESIDEFLTLYTIVVRLC